MLSILILICRSVNRLVLQGNILRVVTHTPLGGTRSLTVPIADVSCTGSRIGKLKLTKICHLFRHNTNLYVSIITTFAFSLSCLE